MVLLFSQITPFNILSMTSYLPAVTQKLLLRLLANSYTPTHTDIVAIQNLTAYGYGKGWLQQCDLIYPVMGGTAASQKLELLHPAGTFDLAYTGTVTHTASGMNGDGSTGFASTGYNPATNGVNWTANLACFGVYCNNMVADSGTIMGARNAVTARGSALILDAVGTGTIAGINFTAGLAISPTGPFTNDLYVGQRNSSTTVALFINGVSAATNSDSVTVTNNTFLIMADQNSAGTITEFTASRWAFAFVSGLIPSQAAFNVDVANFQIRLGRA
jgi:hypothetical protein